ncbi:MAG TPA: hypothetical protein VF263_08890 [Longimicrobiaceae bacterium]
MNPKQLLALVPALALAAGAASAQVPLRVGQTATGRLDSSDPKAPDNSFYELYSITGKRGERVVVTMRASTFDAYVTVGRPNSGSAFDPARSDDDGGGGRDARLAFTLGEDGTYPIRANSVRAGETGEYTIQVEQGSAGEESPVVVSLGPLPDPVAIRAGQTLSGELTEQDALMGDNSHYDLYSITGRRGDLFRITMRSGAFDSYMSFGRRSEAAFDPIESNDDGAGGQDAKLEVALPDDGTFLIRANSLAAEKYGAYTVQVESVPPGTPGFAGMVDISRMPRIQGSRTVTGELEITDPKASDNTFYDDYLYVGKAGERLIITLRSEAFDTYLHLGKVQDGKFSSIDTEDDGAGGTDSLMAATLPADGEYVIRVNSLHKSAGPYTLKVESTSPGART